MPGSNLWGQTFMKRYSGASGRGEGEYVYTSDLKKMQAQNDDGANQHTELLGYFHVGNQHNDSENIQAWDKQQIKHSNFGREILHCLHSQNYNPWSVLERFPWTEGPQDFYLIYACGADFVLSGANLKVEMAMY